MKRFLNLAAAIAAVAAVLFPVAEKEEDNEL